MSNKAFCSKLYFSYGQLMVFDRDVALPGCDWSSAHSAQGFARRDATVCVRTLLEFGDADVGVYFGPYAASDRYVCVISVPLNVTSGVVIIEGPEESDTDRAARMRPGSYRLTIAQAWSGIDAETVDLFFERVAQPLLHSQIVLRDQALDPPSQLIETAGIPDEE